jgi:hypothetical protein
MRPRPDRARRHVAVGHDLPLLAVPALDPQFRHGEAAGVEALQPGRPRILGRLLRILGIGLEDREQVVTGEARPAHRDLRRGDERVAEGEAHIVEDEILNRGGRLLRGGRRRRRGPGQQRHRAGRGEQCPHENGTARR